MNKRKVEQFISHTRCVLSPRFVHRQRFDIAFVVHALHPIAALGVRVEKKKLSVRLAAALTHASSPRATGLAAARNSLGPLTRFCLHLDAFIINALSPQLRGQPAQAIPLMSWFLIQHCNLGKSIRGGGKIPLPIPLFCYTHRRIRVRAASFSIHLIISASERAKSETLPERT